MRAPWTGALGVLLAGWRGGAAAAEPAPTGLAVFTRRDHAVDVRISPGGTYLAAVSMDGGRRGLAIIDLAHRKLSTFFRPEGTTGVGAAGSATTGWRSSWSDGVELRRAGTTSVIASSSCGRWRR